jgi:hypothetical protein
MTVLSVLGGFYAQWQDTTTENLHSKERQDQMLRVLTDTRRSVDELSRVLQPIDNVTVTLILEPDCTDSRIEQFCESSESKAMRRAADDARHHRYEPWIEEKAPWVLWPGRNLYQYAYVDFFKASSDADRYFQNNCETSIIKRCDPDSDMHFDVPVLSARDGKWQANIRVLYWVEQYKLSMIVAQDEIKPRRKSDKLLSIADIPGSSMLLSGSLFDMVKPVAIEIQTERGQFLRPLNPRTLMRGGDRAFVYQFAVPTSSSTGSEDEGKGKPGVKAQGADTTHH